MLDASLIRIVSDYLDGILLSKAHAASREVCQADDVYDHLSHMVQNIKHVAKVICILNMICVF